MTKYSNRAYHYFPKLSYSVSGSILINGTEVKEKMISASIDMAASSRAGSCEIRLYNKDGEYTGMFSKKDAVKIYADYGNGTTQQFDGYVREINHEFDRFPILVIKGLDWMGEALNNPVNRRYSSMAISDIFTDLVENYLPGHTTANVGTISTTASPVFAGKGLLDCFIELMTLANDDYCFYCDFAKDWHVFEKGTVFNAYEPIVKTRNLVRLSTEDSLDNMATKITLYGAPQDGLPMFVTVSNDPEGLGTMHKVIKDTNITGYAALLEKAEAILASMNTSEVKGKKAVVKGMMTLKRGDTVHIFAPEMELDREVLVMEFRHDIGKKAMKTTCSFQVQHKKNEDLATIIRKSSDDTQKLLDIDNPDDLENSYNFTFDDSSNISSSNCAVSGGKLILSAGQTTGTMTTSARESSSDITKFELMLSGANLDACVFEANADGIDDHFETVSRDTLKILDYPGKTLRIRVTLSETGTTRPEIDGLSGAYT